MQNILWKISKLVICAAVLLLCFNGLRALHYAARARFTVDVLEKFIQMYYEEHRKYPASLESLPGINVVSYREGLAFDSKALKNWQGSGYRYAYELLDQDRFVLSASPDELWSTGIEFGITEEGFLKFNALGVDASADSHEEVKGWKAILRTAQVVTRISR